MVGKCIEYVGKKRLRQILADVSEATIWRWVQSGRLPKPRQIGPNRVAWLLHELAPALEAFPVANSDPICAGSQKGRKPKMGVTNP